MSFGFGLAFPHWQILSGGLRPSLALNFLTQAIAGTFGTLDPRVSFSRGSSATRINAAGLVETVAAGVPRFQFDPTDSGQRGPELFAALDLTTLGTAGAVSARTANSFTTTGAGGVLTSAGTMTVGKTYQVVVSGNTTASRVNFRNPASLTGSTGANTGAFSLNVTLTWSDQNQFYIQNESAGVTTITSISVREVIPVQVAESYGPELVTNGDFSSTTGWILGGTWTISSGSLVGNASANNVSQLNVTTAGKWYRVSFAYNSTSGVQIRICNTSGTPLILFPVASGTSGVASGYVYATGTTVFIEASGGPYTGTIDNFSVREYLGTVNPATPNLVTNGDFSNGSTGWTIDGSWTVANGVATKTAASSATIFQTSASITTGRSYIVEYTAAGATVDAIRINVRTPLDSIQTGYINQNGPVRVVFTSTATGAFGLFAFANNVSVDNISVREISTAESLYGPTLLTNGDFSSGLSSWSSVITGGTVISVVAGAAVFTGGNGATDFLLQPVNCTLNRVYRLRIVGPVGGQVRVVQNYSPFGTVSTFDITQAGGQTFYFVAPATGAHGIRIYRNTAPSPATFDDVVVQEYLGDRQGSVATPLGLLVEEQRSNLLTWSEAFDNAAWTKLNSTVTASAGVAPDGTPSARLLTATTTSEEVYVSTLSKTATAAAYTLSVYVKRDVTTEPFLIVLSDNVSGEAVGTFNLATQTATAANGTWSAASAVMTFAGNGWFRCSLTATSPANTGLLPGFRWASSAGQTVLLWGAQLEAGAFLTTYIPTFGATATRAGDFPIIEGANFSAFYNQSAGTLFAEASVSSLGIARYIAQADDNGTANRHAFLVMESNLGRLFTANASAVQADITVAPTVTAGVPFRYAAAYALDSFAVSVGGTTPTQDLTGTPPTVDRLRVGTGIGGANLNGVLRRLDYYPTRLPNQQLQALTTV